MTWEPSHILIAEWHGPSEQWGYVYRSLGLWMTRGPSKKGRRPPRWSLTHLGSGHRVCFLHGTVAVAFPVASEIAECSDWSFDGLRGWQNHDPELPDKLVKIAEAHPKVVTLTVGHAPNSEDVARAIAQARAK